MDREAISDTKKSNQLHNKRIWNQGHRRSRNVPFDGGKNSPGRMYSSMFCILREAGDEDLVKKGDGKGNIDEETGNYG